MARPRKVNKVPMTTVAISEELTKDMLTCKKSQESWYDFINRVFKEWRVLRAEHSKLLEESNKLEEDIRADYEARITFLQKQLAKEEVRVESKDVHRK